MVPFCLETFCLQVEKVDSPSRDTFWLNGEKQQEKPSTDFFFPIGIYMPKKNTKNVFLHLEKSTEVFFPPHHKKVTYSEPSFPSEESRVNKVSEEVRIGQEVSVRVLSAEGKLTLSMKPISFWERKKTQKKKSVKITFVESLVPEVVGNFPVFFSEV